MKIELNLDAGDKQQQFMDYLNAELRTTMPSSNGKIEINNKGEYESTTTGEITLGDEKFNLSLVVTRDNQGKLISLSASSNDEQVSEEKWFNGFNSLVNSVLVSAFSERKSRYFIRLYYFYIGSALDGEYWLNGYRVAPVDPSDSEPHIINAERAICLDQDIYAINEENAGILAEERATRLISRLTFILNIEIYKGDFNRRWVIPEVEGQSLRDRESQRIQLGYIPPKSARIASMPKKGVSCPLGKWEGILNPDYAYLAKLNSLPPETRKILKSIDGLEPNIRDAFDSCIRLYQVSIVCGRKFPSAGLAYRVGAVDALSKADKSCKGFSEFMRKYMSDRDHLDEFLDFLYGSVRSAHFHSGQFPIGEFTLRSFSRFIDYHEIHKDAVLRECFKLTRDVIISWLFKTMPELRDDAKSES
jgi:hypothetical protein